MPNLINNSGKPTVDWETCQRCMHTFQEEMKRGFADTHARLDVANGRIRKMEVSVAVLQFAVLTVGAALAYGGMQIVIAKLSGGS